MPEYQDSDRDRRITQLRKGILELAVLRILSEQRHYGYSLARALSGKTGLDLKEGTLYPILARLDRDGLLRSSWVESNQGPPRKYYEITSAGKALLTELTTEFELLIQLVREPWPAPNAKTDEDFGHELLSIQRA